jgi:hypothetical protein
MTCRSLPGHRKPAGTAGSGEDPATALLSLIFLAFFGADPWHGPSHGAGAVSLRGGSRGAGRAGARAEGHPAMGAGLSVVVVCGPEFVVGALPQKLHGGSRCILRALSMH